MSDAGADDSPAVPTWDDEYVDRVGDRLQFSYDLEKDYAVRGERFALYGQLRVETEKHFVHPALTYARQESVEHLFVRRARTPTVADLEALADLGHALADEQVDADERHFSTDFTFALVVPEIPPDVESFVAGFRDRTLLKYGYNGHYEVNLVVAAPDEEQVVGSSEADTAAAFDLWESADAAEASGLLSRVAGLLGR